MIISQKVQQQIKYLCKEIPNEEWSGVLYYTTKGTVKDLKNFEVTAVDIVPLDIGSASFTNYHFRDYDITQKWMDLGVGNVRLGHRVL